MCESFTLAPDTLSCLRAGLLLTNNCGNDATTWSGKEWTIFGLWVDSDAKMEWK